MSKQREALQVALKALEEIAAHYPADWEFDICIEATRLAREALAEPEQEPVAWTTTGQIAAMDSGFLRYIEGRDPRFVLGRHDDVPLYISPPARKPLTDEQIDAEFDRECWVTVVFADGTKGIALDRVTARDFARAIERAHGISES